jgi:hypothetical protein
MTWAMSGLMRTLSIWDSVGDKALHEVIVGLPAGTAPNECDVLAFPGLGQCRVRRVYSRRDVPNKLAPYAADLEEGEILLILSVEMIPPEGWI